MENRENDFIDPQKFAWKLLLDEDIKKPYIDFIDINNDSNNYYDKITFEFEILLTVLLEMLYNCLIICNMTSITHDFIEENINTIIEKFHSINIIPNFHTYERKEDEYLREIINERYCRVVLRQDKENEYIFYKNNVPHDVNYHMIGNEKFVNKEHMNDIYAIIMIDDKVYKISFDKLIEEQILDSNSQHQYVE